MSGNSNELDTFSDFADGCSLQGPEPYEDLCGFDGGLYGMSDCYITAAPNPNIVFTQAATQSYVNAQTGVESTIELDVDGTTRVKGELVVESKDGEQINVGDTLKTISERLCVLQPNFEAMEQYPALKDAYEQYKMLEKLLMDNAKKG